MRVKRDTEAAAAAADLTRSLREVVAGPETGFVTIMLAKMLPKVKQFNIDSVLT